MAQSAVHRCEAECSGLQDHNQSLSHQLARSASHLTIAHTRLRYTRMAESAKIGQRLSFAGSGQHVLDASQWCTHQIAGLRAHAASRPSAGINTAHAWQQQQSNKVPVKRPQDFGHHYMLHG